MGKRKGGRNKEGREKRRRGRREGGREEGSREGDKGKEKKKERLIADSATYTYKAAPFLRTAPPLVNHTSQKI